MAITYKTIITNAINGFNDIQNIISDNTGLLTKTSTVSGQTNNLSSIDDIKTALNTVSTISGEFGRSTLTPTLTYGTILPTESYIIGSDDYSIAGTQDATDGSKYYLKVTSGGSAEIKGDLVVTPGLTKGSSAQAPTTVTGTASNSETKYIGINAAKYVASNVILSGNTYIPVNDTPNPETGVPPVLPGPYAIESIDNYIIGQTPASGWNGFMFHTRTKVEEDAPGNISFSQAGYVPKDGSIDVSVNTKYIDRMFFIGEASFETQASSGTISYGGSNVTYGMTDTGVSVSANASGVSRRGSVSAAGFIKSGMPGDNAGSISGGSKFITDIAIPSGKTFNSITNDGIITSVVQKGEMTIRTDETEGASTTIYNGWHISTDPTSKNLVIAFRD